VTKSPSYGGAPHAAPEESLPRGVSQAMFVFALALRLPMLPRHRLVEGDGVHYATLARAILSGDFSGLANPYWSNLWPAVVAATAWITRLDVVTAGRIASLLAGSGLVVATAVLTTRCLGRSAGIVAGLLAASHPWLIHFSTLVFTESLFALLFVMALSTGLAARGLSGAVVTGVWAGLAVVTRPEAYAAILCIVLAFLLQRGGLGYTEALRRASLFTAIVVVFLVARGLLVHRYYGSWDFGGTKGTANLFVGLAETDSQRERVSTELTPDDQNALARKAEDTALLAFARAHPLRLANHVRANAAEVVASGLRVFPFVPLVGGRPAPWQGGWPPLLVPWAIGLAAVALAGSARALVERRSSLLLSATGLLYAAGLAPFYIHDRLVVPLVPLFLVFLAYGLTRAPGVLSVSPVRRWGLAAFVLLGPVSLFGLIRAPTLDYAGDPVVQRTAGEWLAKHYPQDTTFMTAAPSVGFYFHDAAHSDLEVSLPWANAPRVIEVARRQGARLLVVPEWHLAATQHPAADMLLHPERGHVDLRLVATFSQEDRRMLIYELPSPPS
jgi:4-amino-4-deoxy-L-arabinose transferase-like glycosyltransferase